MAEHPQRRSFNWLDWFDGEAKKLPPATSWLGYSYFMFARYPRLRPVVLKAPNRSQLNLHAGHRAFRESLSEWLRQIQASREARDVLTGLSPCQRNQLAALVADSVEGFHGVGEYQARLKVHKDLCALAVRAPRCQRLRHKKLSEARSALERLIEYERSVAHDLGKDLLVPAENSLKCLPEQVPKIPDFHRLLNDPALHTTPIKTANKYMVRLYWFFRHGCKLSGDDSEVRVALIRNAFWRPHGVPWVDYRKNYATGESRGCDAVHIAVRRYPPDQGTSR